MKRPFAARPVVPAILALLLPAAAQADEGGWSDVAEFSFVQTDGNSETQTLGFKNTLGREWDRSSVVFKVGGIRAESTSVTRFAVGPSASSFSLTELSTTAKTAENYFANGRYDRKITDRFFWYAGAGWERNRFAGIENRSSLVGGVGNIWYDTDKIKFRTDYALTYTDQEDVVPNPAVDDTFAGLRFSWTYKHQFGENTTYGNDLVVDENLDETSDYRADMTNWLAVSMNKRLALKVALQILYDNEPAFLSVPLFDTVGGTQIGSVFVERDDVDTIFTASLVVNF